MRKDVSFVYAVAFSILCAVSVLLYPAANRGASALVWGLLALAVLATGMILVVK